MALDYEFYFSVLWDSWVCEQACLWIHICFLCLFQALCLLFVLPYSDVLLFNSIILYYIMLYFNYPLQTCLFLMRDKKGVDPDRRGIAQELGGTKGGETAIKIHYVRKFIFSIKWKIINKSIKEKIINIAFMHSMKLEGNLWLILFDNIFMVVLWNWTHTMWRHLHYTYTSF